jgi:flagellin
VNINFTISTATGADAFSSAVDAFNAATSKTGVSAQYDAVNGGLKLTNATGETISLVNNNGGTGNSATLKSYTTAGGLGAATTMAVSGGTGAAVGTVTLDSQKSFAVTDASGNGLAGSSTLQSVSSLDVTTYDNAQKAIKIVDSALAAVNNQRAQYGALQNRFQSTVSNLQTTSENLSASRSRIQDTDFAAETASLTRSQILQQAGTAMLAQANQLPQSVLSLLK